jgi:hypothetical protein
MTSAWNARWRPPHFFRLLFALLACGAAVACPRAPTAQPTDAPLYETVVTANQVLGNFKTCGTDRIVLVDPVTDVVTGTIDLPGVNNCGPMTYVDADRRRMVACGGDYRDPKPIRPRSFRREHWPGTRRNHHDLT